MWAGTRRSPKAMPTSASPSTTTFGVGLQGLACTRNELRVLEGLPRCELGAKREDRYVRTLAYLAAERGSPGILRLRCRSSRSPRTQSV